MRITRLARIQSVFCPQPFRLVPRVKQSRVWAFSGVRRQYRRTRRFSPRLDSHEWQGVWDSMGKYLVQWAPPVLWNFTAEQVQNPEKLVKDLNEVCCCSGHTRDGQIMATCWGLAYAYRALFNTIQCLQKEKNVPGSEGKATDSAATPAPSTAATPPPVTSTAATQTSTTTDSTATPAPSTAATPPPVTSTVATQTPVTSTAATQTTVIITAAEPEDQCVPISVAPVRKRKSKKKEARNIKQDEETMYSPPGTASDQESSSHDEEEEVTSRARTSTELRNMRKDFTRQPGEHIITWLLRCWDNGADGHELEGREAKQLGSLAREGGIDKAIAREKKSLSLWRQLLAAVKERFPYKDNVMSCSAKWTALEKGIQSLRESAIVEMIYHTKLDNSFSKS